MLSAIAERLDALAPFFAKRDLTSATGVSRIAAPATSRSAATLAKCTCHVGLGMKLTGTPVTCPQGCTDLRGRRAKQ